MKQLPFVRRCFGDTNSNIHTILKNGSKTTIARNPFSFCGKASTKIMGLFTQK